MKGEKDSAAREVKKEKINLGLELARQVKGKTRVIMNQGRGIAMGKGRILGKG